MITNVSPPSPAQRVVQAASKGDLTKAEVDEIVSGLDRQQLASLEDELEKVASSLHNGGELPGGRKVANPNVLYNRLQSAVQFLARPIPGT